MTIKLPGVSRALVEQRRITDYLLNLAHEQGASKARFFLARGFSLAAWAAFGEALIAQGRNNQVSKVTQTEWDTLSGRLSLPNPGRNESLYPDSLGNRADGPRPPSAYRTSIEKLNGFQGGLAPETAYWSAIFFPVDLPHIPMAQELPVHGQTQRQRQRLMAGRRNQAQIVAQLLAEIGMRAVVDD